MSSANLPDGQADPAENGFKPFEVPQQDAPIVRTLYTPNSSQPSEHPEGDEIRRQVEFYFSDGNLATDEHLLKLCGGAANIPVSINQILGFKKMRRFRPKTQVIESLRKSDFLEVNATGKTIKRKNPIRIPTLLDDDDDDSELAYDPKSVPEEQKPTPRKAKLVVPAPVKKEIPPGMTKGMMKPSGFEENYVEGPITPAQWEEEQGIYDPDLSFVERIEVAIQRFKAKRKMHQKYVEIFSKFMKFGGVEGQQRQFTGKLNKAELEEYDAGEIARMMATHRVDWDRGDKTKWVVDFESIAKAFLSSCYPEHFGPDPTQISRTTQVLRSFYNYLMLHSVCPEYTENILAARRITDLADKELPKMFEVGLLLPGTFNKAASSLYGSYWSEIHPTQGLDKSWDDVDNSVSWGGEMPAAEKAQIFRPEAMNAAFKMGVISYGSEQAYKAISEGGKDAFSAIKIENVGLSVIGTDLPTDDTRALYKAHNEKWKHKLRIEPLGKLHCESWAIPNIEEWDLPPQVAAEKRKTKPQRFTFWVEESTLALCFTGLKITAKVMDLSHGIQILDCVEQVHCSFYKILPNELHMSSKVTKELRYPEHRDLKAKRERAMEAEAEAKEAEAAAKEAAAVIEAAPAIDARA